VTCAKLIFVSLVIAISGCQFSPSEALPADDDGDDVVDATIAVQTDARTSAPIDAVAVDTMQVDAHVTVAPGGACGCDADCASDGGQPGVCIYGVCMVRATGACPSGGAQTGCPAGSRCWNLANSDVGPLCWPDCAAHTCSGTCDVDGSCVPADEDDCDPACGTACS
jgi:hypothetical protein